MLWPILLLPKFYFPLFQTQYMYYKIPKEIIRPHLSQSKTKENKILTKDEITPQQTST